MVTYEGEKDHNDILIAIVQRRYRKNEEWKRDTKIKFATFSRNNVEEEYVCTCMHNIRN